MFDRIPVIRRNIFTTIYKILCSSFRCLRRTIAFLGVTWLWLLCALYVISEYTFTRFYLLALRTVSRPAFPLSWRLLLMTLFVVPMIALVRVLWLATYLLILVCRWGCSKTGARPSSSQGYIMLPRNEATSPEEGRRDDEDRDMTDIEGDTGSSRTCPLLHIWGLWLCFWFAILCISLSVALNFRHPGDSRYLPQIEQANAHPRREGYNNNGDASSRASTMISLTDKSEEKIFIAAMFSNHKGVIPYWSDSLVQAIHYLGEDNVFVSILESESEDESPALLRQLDDRLEAMNVPRRIVTGEVVVSKPANMSDEERIHYLAALRNAALTPLVETGGYDKILFSNDVFIEPESIVELLKTADGEYDMACAMDFGNFGLYDAWVIRDKRGSLLSSIWPYFFDQEDCKAMQSETAVPVFTCWNGIVVFAADPVLPIHLRSNRTLSSRPLPFALPVTHPVAHDPSMRGPSPALTPPIGFRASELGECYSSESFLLPYDFRRVFNLQRIFVNPRVIVGYTWRMYVYFKWLLRHPVLKWWIERVYDGAWMHKIVTVVGDDRRVSRWDGGDCHPW